MYISGRRINRIKKKPINIEMISLIITLVLFAINLTYSTYTTYAESKTRKDNIRTMLAYEINKNESIFKFLYNTRNLTNNNNDENIEQKPIHLDILGKTKLSFLNKLDNKVFLTYFKDINILPPDEVTLLMQYHTALEQLKNDINQASVIIDKKVKPDIVNSIEWKINHNFIIVFKVSDELMKRYHYIIPKLISTDVL